MVSLYRIWLAQFISVHDVFNDHWKSENLIISVFIVSGYDKCCNFGIFKDFLGLYIDRKAAH